MMNKKEKKALQGIKNYLKESAINDEDHDFFKNGGFEMVDLEIPKAMQKLVNLIDKQEKKRKRAEQKILKLNKQNEKLSELIETMKRNVNNEYISKDKIERKIEEIEDECNKKFGNCKISYYESELAVRDIRLLKELLGGKNE